MAWQKGARKINNNSKPLFKDSFYDKILFVRPKQNITKGKLLWVA
jgi:hypothetical protein